MAEPEAKVIDVDLVHQAYIRRARSCGGVFITACRRTPYGAMAATGFCSRATSLFAPRTS